MEGWPVGYLHSVEELNNHVNVSSSSELAWKPDITYVDSENAKQDFAIADKASKSYVNSENGKQNIAIADEASKSYVDSCYEQF